MEGLLNIQNCCSVLIISKKVIIITLLYLTYKKINTNSENNSQILKVLIQAKNNFDQIIFGYNESTFSNEC